MAKHILRSRMRPPTDFANQSEVSDADAAVLASATGREEGRAGDEPENLPEDLPKDLPKDLPLSDFEAEVRDHAAGAQPRSEITGGPQGGTPGEDEDGLDDVARALREAAEGPVGRKGVGE
jgi:hypothetical protein